MEQLEEKKTNIFRAGKGRKKGKKFRKSKIWNEEWWSKAWKGIWYYYKDAEKCADSAEGIVNNDMAENMWVDWSSNQEVGNNVEGSEAAKKSQRRHWEETKNCFQHTFRDC